MHSYRIREMIQLLNSMGYSVQLKHDPTEDRSCEGRVVVSTADGVELARHDSAMTNGNYYERPALFAAMSKTVQSELAQSKTAKAGSEDVAAAGADISMGGTAA